MATLTPAKLYPSQALLITSPDTNHYPSPRLYARIEADGHMLRGEPVARQVRGAMATLCNRPFLLDEEKLSAEIDKAEIGDTIHVRNMGGQAVALLVVC